MAVDPKLPIQAKLVLAPADPRSSSDEGGEPPTCCDSQVQVLSEQSSQRW